MFSPEILECEDPLYVQDEESGEQVPIEKSVVRECVRRHAPLLTLLNDMQNGVVHLTLAEYNAVSHKQMFAWLSYKNAVAERRKRDQQAN